MTVTATRGFEIMNKVCDILKENGCPEFLEVDLGAEIYSTVIHELGVETEMDTDFMSLISNVLGNNSDEI